MICKVLNAKRKMWQTTNSNNPSQIIIIFAPVYSLRIIDQIEIAFSPHFMPYLPTMLFIRVNIRAASMRSFYHVWFVGGATYCAVAALSLCGHVHSTLNEDQQERVQRWCIDRQASGFQGRTNKQPNSSYSFWVGATLKVTISLVCFTLHQI